MQIYLAGACRDIPDGGKTWRKNVREWFNTYEKCFPSRYTGVKVYDPTEYFSRNGEDSINGRQVRQFYLKYAIKNCDLILVNLNDSNYSVGTACELQYAECHEIPIIGFGKTNVYEWFPDYCDVVFEREEEALNYIADYYM